MFVVLFVVVILGAIMLHEFGHFVTAKAFGMKATQFFVGFGPTLWSTHKGETEYGVKGIPAGGFVKIAGMTPWEESDPADDGRLFYQQAPWKRLIVLSAGSFTHLILAIVLLFGALAFIGPDTEATNEVAAVPAGSPAVSAGLQPGDIITGVDGRPTPTFEEVRAALKDRFGDSVTLDVVRRDQELTLDTTLDVPHPVEELEGDGYLGVNPHFENQPLGIVDGARQTFDGPLSIGAITGATVDSLRQVFSAQGLSRFFGSVGSDEPRQEDSPVSLVGAGQIVNELGNQGQIFMVVLVLAQLNLVLGLLNMLPLPPLDGGHVAVMAVEEAVNGIRRLGRGAAPAGSAKFHLNPNIVTPIALAVLAFFLVLSTTALYLDITSPVSELLQ